MGVRGRHKWTMLGIAAIVVGLCLLARSTGLLGSLEQRTLDTRFAVRGVHGAPDVAVVGLDEASYFHLQRPPLPRANYGTIIRNLRRAGAKVIALDLALERPSPSPRDDRSIVDALIKARPAVVSVTAVGANGVTDPLAGRVPFSYARRGARNDVSCSRQRWFYPPVSSGLPRDPHAAARRSAALSRSQDCASTRSTD